MKRLFLSAFLIAATSLFGAQKPNIVLIMTDDQGYGDFGCMGNPIIETPHLDKMSERSVSWEEFYVSPVCSPTRASLMTGRYNPRTMVVDTWLGRSMMHPDETTLAEVLNEAGYATGIFGKWHLGDNYPMRPGDQGFEESLIHRGGGIGQPADPRDGGRRYTNPVLLQNDYEVVMDGYCTDVFFNEAGKFMDKANDNERPFFAYISLNAPHSPYHDVPEALYQHYKAKDMLSIAIGDYKEPQKEADRLARIAAMITNIDENVGRLFEKLKADGTYENTIVIFLTDNGPNTRRYVRQLRGKKSELHEGGIRTPLWIEWPAKLKPASVEKRVAAHIDLMPTLLEACGVKQRGLEMDGHSLLKQLKKPTANYKDRPLVIQYHRGDRLVKYHSCMVREGEWKLVHASGTQRRGFQGEPKWELYNLGNDQGESNDLIAQEPDVAARLLEVYENWFADVTATRANTTIPTPIIVDRKHENPCVLTWQDWFDGAWSAQRPGKWRLNFAHSGRMDVRVELPKNKKLKGDNWTCTLKIGEVETTLPLLNGEDWVTFEALSLPAGIQIAEANFANTSGDKHAAYHVRILHR